MLTTLLLVLVVILLLVVLWKHKALKKDVKGKVEMLHLLASKDFALLNGFIGDAESRLRGRISKFEQAAVADAKSIVGLGVQTLPSTTASAPTTAIPDATGTPVQVPTVG